MKIYMTQKISDMTEGRGYMVNDIAFLFKDDAEEYIDSKLGVMGRKKRWSEEEYGDWQVKEIDVRESAYNAQYEAKLKALAKLTKEEQTLLGINL